MRTADSNANLSALVYDHTDNSLGLNFIEASPTPSEPDSRYAVDEDVFDGFAQQRIRCELHPEFTLSKLDTCNVIPVDLNVFLCKVEGYLAEYHEILNDKEDSNQV